MNKAQILNDLSQNYTKPSHPIAYSGINNIYNYYDGKLSQKEIQSFLGGNESYTVHREFKNLQRNPSYARFKRYQMQIDLADVRDLQRWNDGVTYIFVCIDPYSRHAWAVGLLNKTADATLDGFKFCLDQAGSFPVTLVSDRGSEIVNHKFKKFCEDNNINLMHNYTSVHASYVERFNRTLKRLMYSYMTQNETNRYIHKLDDFLHTYNSRKHRMIGMTPQEAEQAHNRKRVDEANQRNYDKVKKKKPKFIVGQLVRIALQKTPFSRGYKDQTNYEVFKIKRIKTKLPIPLYILQEFDESEELRGGFYAHEITPVNSDVFRIERMIKKKKVRGQEYHFVKWKGFADKYNSWITSEDVTEKFNQDE